METTHNIFESPFDAWVQFLNSSNWSDDRNYYQTTRNAFLEAWRLGINQPEAFFVVANQLHQAGKTVVWPKLHNLWLSARQEWKALRAGHGVKPPPSARPVIGDGSQQPIRHIASFIMPTFVANWNRPIKCSVSSTLGLTRWKRHFRPCHGSKWIQTSSVNIWPPFILMSKNPRRWSWFKGIGTGQNTSSIRAGEIACLVLLVVFGLLSTAALNGWIIANHGRTKISALSLRGMVVRIRPKPEPLM